ncbi:hypothetical protein BaRGS_00010233 [Batillaria attramentaria]|uniref:Uncharacterized protein n=1 Tax=Batillaria attramentaria TaxID=370345 RepID=A0ABD0LHK1_9CAEN
MTNRLFLTTMLCCVVCIKGSANLMITTAGFELVESNWNDKHFLLSGDSHKVAPGDFVSPLRSQADEDRGGTVLLTEPANDTRSISEDYNTTVEMIQWESTNDTGDIRLSLAGAQQISENETVTEHVQRIIENYNTTVEMMHSESTNDTGDIRTPLVGAQQTSETETVTEHVRRISEDYNTTEEMTQSEWTNDTGDIGTSVVGSPQTLEHDVVTQDVQRMNGSLQISTVGFQFSISTLGVDEDMRGSSSESPASGRETSANESLGLSFDVNGSLLEETTSLRLTEPPTNGLNTETSERGVTFFGLSSPRPGSPPEDQPIISSELAEKIIDVLDKVRLPLEMASGLVTFTSACVYLLPDMRSPTAMYLVSMNLLDTVSVVTGNVGLIWRLAAGNDVTVC